MLFMLIVAVYSEDRTKPIMQPLFCNVKGAVTYSSSYALKGSEYQRNVTRTVVTGASDQWKPHCAAVSERLLPRLWWNPQNHVHIAADIPPAGHNNSEVICFVRQKKVGSDTYFTLSRFYSCIGYRNNTSERRTSYLKTVHLNGRKWQFLLFTNGCVYLRSVLGANWLVGG
jgi:hypothetical protein